MTSPGPPPTPVRLRLLRGNPGRRPIRPEPQPLVPKKVPEPPDFLHGYACDEWHRIAGELHRLGRLTVLDVAVLAAYCTSYSHWRTAEETLQRTTDPRERAILARISRDAAKGMMRFAAELGFRPRRGRGSRPVMPRHRASSRA